MSKRSEEFLIKMKEFLPSSISDKCSECVNEYGEVLETVIIEDIIMPEILKLLYENKNTALLVNIFKYFERVVNCDDSHLINVFSITVLEVLGNDKIILGTAKNYMGRKTALLQAKVDRELGRK